MLRTPPRVTFTFRLAPALLESIQTIADKQRRTVSATMEMLVEAGLAQLQRKVAQRLSRRKPAKRVPA